MISVRVTQPHCSDLSLDQKLCLKRSNGSFEVLCLLSDLAVDNGEQSQYFKPHIALFGQTSLTRRVRNSVLNRIIKRVQGEERSVVG